MNEVDLLLGEDHQSAVVEPESRHAFATHNDKEITGRSRSSRSLTAFVVER
jgi:hypothetical protein